MQLTMSSGSSAMRSMTALTSSSVAERMASGSLASTVMAPRSARSFMRRRIVSGTEGRPDRRWWVFGAFSATHTHHLLGRPPSMPPFRAIAPLRRPPQALHLGLREAAALSRLEAAQAERPEGNPLQVDDAVAHRLEHPAHLALPPLADRELDDARGRLAHLRRRGEPVLELDAVLQRGQRARG